LTSALDGGEWSDSRHRRFTPGERAPGTHLIGGWVGPRAGLDDVEKRKLLTPLGLELLLLSRPARSQLLYQLRYPGSSESSIPTKNQKQKTETIYVKFFRNVTRYASNREILNTRIRNYLDSIFSLIDRIKNKRINWKCHLETVETARISKQLIDDTSRGSYVGRTCMYKEEWNGSKAPNLDIALSRTIWL
jgi:hypothetical protein